MFTSQNRQGVCIFCSSVVSQKATPRLLRPYSQASARGFRDETKGELSWKAPRRDSDSYPTKPPTIRKLDARTLAREQYKDRNPSPYPKSGPRPTVGTRHASFRPGSGDLFDRNALSKPRSQSAYSDGFSARRKDDIAQKITDRLNELETLLPSDPILKKLNVNDKTLNNHFRQYKKKVLEALDARDVADPAFLKRLKDAWIQKSTTGLDLELKYSFFGHVVASRFSPSDVKDQERLANLKYPSEWYPSTRGFQREFHLHIGPTNSGKTYHALKRLEEAETGLYAGPLRLLAHEVYMRLNARGKRCNLITGDERRAADEDVDAPMVSSTVEMIPLNAALDVAVIDEIQLIGSEDRGWAWTQAVLGVMAKEVHLCGEERTLPIIQELVALCGEKLHVHRYQRLSPLKMASRSLDGNLRNLQKGDCVVAFSVMVIHGLRRAIERAVGCKVAIIYGSLPPETRAQQARLFNDPNNNYDILVASNAVGMGLNLSIKRLIFQSSERNVAGVVVKHSIAEIKQIAGRAGRYSTAEQDMKKTAGSNTLKSTADVSQDTVQADTASTLLPAVRSEATAVVTPPKSVGLVTTLERYDFTTIEKAMKSEAEPILSAGLFPPSSIVERFARYFPPGTPFSYVLVRLHELSQMSSRFHLCDLRQQVSIADAIESVEGLEVPDKLIFCAAPIEPRKPGEPELARAYARFVAQSKAVSIVDVEELNLELLEDEYVADRPYLRKLEELHKGVIVFMWLSYRFAGVFVERELALHVKHLVEARIEAVLEKLAFDYEQMRTLREQEIIGRIVEESENAAKARSDPDRAAEVLREEMPDDPVPDRMEDWSDIPDDTIPEATSQERVL